MFNPQRCSQPEAEGGTGEKRGMRRSCRMSGHETILQTRPQSLQRRSRGSGHEGHYNFTWAVAQARARWQMHALRWSAGDVSGVWGECVWACGRWSVERRVRARGARGQELANGGCFLAECRAGVTEPGMLPRDPLNLIFELMVRQARLCDSVVWPGWPRRRF
jgi:hypothetical protein